MNNELLKRKSSGEKEKISFAGRLLRKSVKIKSYGTDILQIFQNLMLQKEENFTEEKPELTMPNISGTADLGTVTTFC